MQLISMIGGAVVTAALISYSIGIITEQRKSLVSKKVLSFLSIGVILDIAATIMMIIGSRNSPFTFHGFVGYSALALMLTDTILIWRFFLANGSQEKVNKKLHFYTRFAYIWWVLAYITGSLLVFLK